jgi:hypothetical protein
MSSMMSRGFTDWTFIDRSWGDRNERKIPQNEQDTPVLSVTWSPWGWVCGGEGWPGGREGGKMGDGNTRIGIVIHTPKRAFNVRQGLGG